MQRNLIWIDPKLTSESKVSDILKLVASELKYVLPQNFKRMSEYSHHTIML